MTRISHPRVGAFRPAYPWLAAVTYVAFAAFTFSAIDLAMHLRDGRDVGGWHDAMYGAVREAADRLSTKENGR